MKSTIRPFKLGNTTLPSNVFYAPLAGCSDFPFRQMSALYRPGLIYCEMVKMDALVRHDPGTFHMLDYNASMHPIGGQLCGAKPEIAGKAAKIIEDLGFDVVDLNCGCPVDKVTKDGSGSGLLKNPQLIGDLVANMTAAVKIPVTIKIRAGWDEESINAVEITKIAEAAGVKAICIHGRTRRQAYKGPANWDWIKQCKEAATTIQVIGNGDIQDAASARKIFEHTGCDAILVARGTMGHPWVADDIYRLFNGEEIIQRNFEDCRKALLQHFHYMSQYHQERRVIIDMRRVGCWYFKKSAGTRQFREIISKATSISDLRNLIENFNFDQFPAVASEEEESEDCC
jgi:nifR3 family TIM-barrel protein